MRVEQEPRDLWGVWFRDVELRGWMKVLEASLPALSHKRQRLSSPRQVDV